MTKTVYKNKDHNPTEKWVNVFVNKCGNCEFWKPELLSNTHIYACTELNNERNDDNWYCGDFKER